ncbi:putative thiazole-containing bacteriocin maturation protein [Paenibacillus filicis]|uniref:Thiazole-containing bacteriocin maturation protein n=1 Tax=Paenibacillus gyeongsangnamensis TaxID=3388067 RepID=A0ABT4Q4U6_9BACL|nr:putative thiazole-containing bacteriocin maturation protein [Paenibacillus filicis]MCZ8511836.1 putative thiazole-containing bacteriocin maturation protein [Paenibacillus filicis]
MDPSMRLKVNGDVFYLPEADGSVYFRNNVGSFRMEGRAIDQWIEKLLPALDGNQAMSELTSGLPDEYKARIYELADVLHRNGFVRDVSRDFPHQLPESVLSKFASQIEFLDGLGGSGASRFETYRRTKVAAVGSGPFAVSLVQALLESGLPKLRLIVTDDANTNRERIGQLAAHARQSDPDADIETISVKEAGTASWREMIRPFDVVVAVSERGDVSTLRQLQTACSEEKKLFIPALCIEHTGMAGPVIRPGSETDWESAWRRIHRDALNRDPALHTFSATAGSMLANVTAFEMFKAITGVSRADAPPEFYLLNLETLEGDWHTFLPRLFTNEARSAEPVGEASSLLDTGPDGMNSNELLIFFSRLTSPVTGILHQWEEGDLIQLPLAQCRVQPADPLSEGPADLLPECIVLKLTHEEARREAGLIGLEDYVSHIAGRQTTEAFIAVGVGANAAESLGRGLLSALTEELRFRFAQQPPALYPAYLTDPDDERCRFYLRALTTLQGAPVIARSEDVHGFPVLWAGTTSGWYGSTGLHRTAALRSALELALLQAQNKGIVPLARQGFILPPFSLKHPGIGQLDVPPIGTGTEKETVHSALEVLNRHAVTLEPYRMPIEPFMKDQPISVIGVALRKEGDR